MSVTSQHLHVGRCWLPQQDLASCTCAESVLLCYLDCSSRTLHAQALNKGLEPDLSDRLMSFTGNRTLFSADTDSKHWRLVRKGVAPAFSPTNIRRGHAGGLAAGLGRGQHQASIAPGAAHQLARQLMLECTCGCAG